MRFPIVVGRVAFGGPDEVSVDNTARVFCKHGVSNVALSGKYCAFLQSRAVLELALPSDHFTDVLILLLRWGHRGGIFSCVPC